MTIRRENRSLVRNSVPAPLGRITLAGQIAGGEGLPSAPLRVLGRYAAVYVLAGHGVYGDANGYAQAVGAGDLILVFPELGHTYGPRRGNDWDELYVVFEGAVFEACRRTRLLDPGRPVVSLGPEIASWYDKLVPFVREPLPMTSVAKSQEVCRFLSVLTEMLLTGAGGSAEPAGAGWLLHACRLLEGDLDREQDLADLAAQVGLSYETFRKRFQKAMGVSPARYRTQQRIEAARNLLQYTRMTNQQVAENLGFADEFHFSKRFKQITGWTPRQFRRRLLS